MLKISNLTKKYNNFTLDNINLEVESGRITGILGANGAGKSTTFKSILGLVKPDSGEILLDDKDVRKFTRSEKALIGTVLPDSFFVDVLKVKDIVNILKATFPTFDEKYFKEKCEIFKIPMDKKIREFSSGMKTKLKMISAVSYDTKLLILDEPTVGLDVVAREDVLDCIREYVEKDEERSVIISSHISSDIEKLCDDIYMIHDGKIIMHEDTDVLLSEYAVIKVDEEQFNELDKQYVKAYRKESYGYECLASQKGYYSENYPSIVVEKTNIDEMMMILIKGEQR